MTSRYLSLIEDEISRASDQVSADCSRCKLAAYLVRQGKQEEASTTLRELRARYNARPNARISAWMNFVEALEFMFDGAHTAALDKMQRAHALAAAASLQPMRSLCAGWLANLKFGTLDVEAMSQRLIEAFQYSDDADHQALSRSCLVSAVALHFANRYDLARPWYLSARAHATEESDEATISALLYNSTCMGVANLRQAVLTGVGQTQSVPNALLEAESTINYDSLVGTASASAWAPILKAQAASLLGRSAQALRIYEEYIDAGTRQGMGRVLCYMHADMAWCYAQTGAVEKSCEYVELAESSFAPATLVDDRAAAHSRLSAVLSLLDRRDASSRHAASAAELWSAFSQLQSTIVVRIGQIALR